MAKKVVDWFTMNGKHIPIYEGESKTDAVNRSIADDNENKKSAQISKNKQIADDLNKKVSITGGKDAISNLNGLKSGTPVKLKLGKDLDYKQAIYMGKNEIQGRDAYQFYDGSGIDGTFGLSDRFLTNNGEVKLKLNDNNVESTAKLLKQMQEAEQSQEKGNFLTDLQSDNPDYEKIATDINDSVENAGYMMLEKGGKVILFGKNYNDNFSEIGPEKPTRGMDSVGMAKRIKADIDGKWSTHKYDGQIQFPVKAINKNAPANGFYNAIIIDQLPSSASVQKIMTTPNGYGVYRIKNIGNKMFEYVAIKG